MPSPKRPAPPRLSLLRLAALAALAAAALAYAATVLAAPPTVAVTVAPAIPQVGEEATFGALAADPDGGAAPTVAWDFDGNGTFDADGASVKHTFATGGAKTVTVRVTDAANEVTQIQKAVSVNRPPTVTTSHSPADPRVGQAVTFNAEAADADGDKLEVAWDTNNDRQFGDAPRRTYTRAGNFSARVRVLDGRGGSVTRTESVAVESNPQPVARNSPPTALISYSPSPPVAGQPVTFSGAGSSDFDGDRLTYAWDLNGDGAFDATGQTVTSLFMGPVRLRVTDSHGLSDEATVVPVGILATPGAPSYALMNPFPIVRIVGTPLRRGAKIKRLSVRAPTGSKVAVSCRGRDCPSPKSSTKRSKGRVIRLRRYERRLRAGTRIGIRISYSNQIGKYTSFVIRRRTRPSRKDLCLPPKTRKPVRCQGG
jgi:PKD repeat protein